MTSNIVKHFFLMPLLLRLATIAMLLSPVLAIGSILSGSITPPQSPIFEYGSAKNLYELILATTVTLPAFLSGLLILNKNKIGIFIFPIGYSSTIASSFVLSSLREQFDQLLISILATSVIGFVFLSTYLFQKTLKII